uniref:Sperm surface protein Sp17 n=1 Tax=Schistosoma japonicum TaxID=6182 RepID=C1LG32_SCHJA|nr:Sperm surface protein Sp17 [Schistosoma japonicum]
MAVPFSNTTLRVPHGFPNLLEGFAREVLRHQPKDIYGFGAKYFEELLLKREETGAKDLAQIGAKLDDWYYNSKGYCTGTCSINSAEHQEAAVRIQAEYRRHLATQETEHIRKTNAATRIQSNFRGYKDRKLVKNMKENQRNRGQSDGQLDKEDEVNLEEVKFIDQTTVSSEYSIPLDNQVSEEKIDLSRLIKLKEYTEDKAAALIQSSYRCYIQRKRVNSNVKVKRLFIGDPNQNSEDNSSSEEDDLASHQSLNSSHHSDSARLLIESQEANIREEQVTYEKSPDNETTEANLKTLDNNSEEGEEELSSHLEEREIILESDKQTIDDFVIGDSNDNTTEDISLANNTESEEQTTEKTPRKENEESNAKQQDPETKD